MWSAEQLLAVERDDGVGHERQRDAAGELVWSLRRERDDEDRCCAQGPALVGRWLWDAGGRRQRGRLVLQRHTAQCLDAGEEPVRQRGAQRASRAGGVAKEAVGLPHVRLCIHLTQPVSRG